MDSKWEEIRVSMPEQIFDAIKAEMAWPIGIMVFGADCDLKSEVLDVIMRELQSLARYYTSVPDTATLVGAVRRHSAVVVVMNAEESAMHGLRHELVKVMRNAGAVSVVGIYVKADKVSVRPLMSNPEKAELNKQVTAIERSNPTADGLDRMIVVTGAQKL